jgi:hypothetical protein
LENDFLIDKQLKNLIKKMKVLLSTVILILASTFATAQNEADTARFIQNLRNDIEQKKYTWVVNKNEIPKFVYAYIVNWKSRNDETGEFDIANPKEDYNSSCFVKPELPFRRLILAGSNGKEWIIFYDHGQGRVHNTKILHIDTKNDNNISFFYGSVIPHNEQTIDGKEKIILLDINALNLCLFQGISSFNAFSTAF